jgi:hypothetical protein
VAPELILMVFRWRMAEAAASHSQLAGVMAGFLFLGITVLVSGSRQEKLQNRDAGRARDAVTLLSTSFIALLFASFLYGAVAGTRDLQLAQSLGSIASLLLALGAVAATAGLAWVVEYGGGLADLERHLERLAVTAYFLAFCFLSVTASDSVQGTSPAPLHGVFYVGVTIGLGEVAAIIVFRHSVLAKRLLKRIVGYRRDDFPDSATIASWAMMLGVVVTAVLFLLSSNAPGLINEYAVAVHAISLVVFHVVAVSVLASMPSPSRNLIDVDAAPSGYL